MTSLIESQLVPNNENNNDIISESEKNNQETSLSIEKKNHAMDDKKKINNSKDKKNKQRKKKRNFTSYSSYIYQIIKLVHPELSITNKGMNNLNSFVNDIFERIAVEAGRLTRYNKKTTMTSREIQSATKMVLRGDLATHAISEGTKAVIKYKSYNKNKQ